MKIKKKIQKKTLITAFTLCILLVTTALLLSSCAMRGIEGRSAYEIALDNGYVGTEKEWLASLKGSDGVDGINGVDGVDGKDGTNGINGADGKDGDDVIKQFTLLQFFNFAQNNGYDGSYSDFISDYLRVDDSTLSDNTLKPANSAILSCVSIFCRFTQSSQFAGAGNSEDDYKYSAGSGVIIKLDKNTGDAYVITNYHVIYNIDSLEENHVSNGIYLYLYGMTFTGSDTLDESGIKAEYVGGSMKYDIAVLRVSASEILKNSSAKAATFADSNKLSVGQTAIAIGNPEGSGFSVTSGIICVDSEYIDMLAVDETSRIELRVMRIDTPVNPGNSGGGLFNSEGELIGIVNAKTSDTSIENKGYAIPGNIAKFVAENIIFYSNNNSGSCVHKCMMGITIRVASSKAVFHEDTGLTEIVEQIQVADEPIEGTLAFGVLKQGDILEKFAVGNNEFEVTRQFVVVDFMLTCRVGDVINVTVIRNGERMTIPMTLTNDCITEIK